MKKSFLRFKKPGILFCAAAALALILLCFFHFRNQVDAYIDEDMRSQMEAIQKNSVQLIQNEMNYLKRMTTYAADMLSRGEPRTEQEILQALVDYADASGIVRALFITLDGRAYTSYAGYLGQSSQDTSIDGIPLSEITSPIFSEAYYAEDLGEVVFGVVAPVSMGSQQGVLVSSYDVEAFSQLLENKFIGGSAEIGIVTSGGEVVNGRGAEEFKRNIFDALGGITFESASAEIMRADFAAGASGYSIYRVNGIAHYCAYAPVGLNDWYSVVMVRESSLRGRLANLERYGFQLTVELVVIMLGLLCVIIAIRLGEQKKIRAILEQAARVDGLTGIYNRKAAEDAIDRALQSADGDARPALLIIDLDDFKQINDRGGHLFGDNVLKACAVRLKRAFGDEGIVGRIGGDEFAVFLPDGRDMTGIQEKVDGLIRDFYVPTAAGAPQKISVSVGLAQSEPGAGSFLSLYQLADAALYRAKQAGKAQLSD